MVIAALNPVSGNAGHGPTGSGSLKWPGPFVFGGGAMCRADAGEAVGLGFDHGLKGAGAEGVSAIVIAMSIIPACVFLLTIAVPI